MHIHSVLSPCGGMEMSPLNIVKEAIGKKLDMIAITDHNSTRHCRLTMMLGEKYGIKVIPGAEVNTREEIHCLTFFENADQCDMFQEYLEQRLVRIKNKPEVFGYQFVVDEAENILSEEENLLVAALDAPIDEVEKRVHQLGGIFVPAHVNRLQNGLYHQLGFLPHTLKADALEVIPNGEYADFQAGHPELARYSLIASSDAHSLGQIGYRTSKFYLDAAVFNELAMAFRKEHNRKVLPA